MVHIAKISILLLGILGAVKALKSNKQNLYSQFQKEADIILEDSLLRQRLCKQVDIWNKRD